MVFIDCDSRMDQAVDRMSKVLLGVEQSAPPNALQRVLFGLSPPSSPDNVGEIQYFNESGLNPSQKRAVKLALASPEIALIHGPPGVSRTADSINLWSYFNPSFTNVSRQVKRIPLWRSSCNLSPAKRKSWFAEQVTSQWTISWNGLYHTRFH